MKKIVILLIVALTLVGCSTPKVKAASNEPLFRIKDRTVTEQDIFDTVMSSDVGHQLVRTQAQVVLLRNIVEEDDAFNKKVAAKLDEAKEYMGDNFKLFLKTNGFDNEEAYVEAILEDLVRLEIAVTQAMSDDYEAIKKLRPREVRLLQVSKSQSAKALELAKAEMPLTDIAKELKIKTAGLSGELSIVSDNSKLDTEPLNKLLNATETGVILEAITATNQTDVYIVEVVNLDADAIKDKVIENFIENDAIVNEYLAKLFVANNFKVYDQDLADRIRANYPGFLK